MGPGFLTHWYFDSAPSLFAASLLPCCDVSLRGPTQIQSRVHQFHKCSVCCVQNAMAMHWEWKQGHDHCPQEQ